MNFLVQRLDSVVSDLLDSLDVHPAARRFLAGDVDTDEYAAFLEQTYLYVRHTRPLLRRAGERLGMLRRAPTLARLFLQKADEEDGHEKWLVADLEAIDRPIDERMPPDPSHAVAAYVAWNQFQVEAGSPLGFLGTAYVLESLSQARAGLTAENLVKKNRIHGIDQGVSFLKGHADADEHHIDLLRRVLGVVSLPADRDSIALSAAVTTALYLGMFSVIESVEESRQAA
ncbi:MAG: iron-containing redox enzyme family protein [Polyangiaceae bacterium]|nr:iron-containing redox enzyme family protein [Polyangiaceae bacterium]